MDSKGVTVSFEAQNIRFDTSEDVEVVCEELNGKDVEILILQGNTFGIEAAERLGLELAKQPHLKEAHFRDLFTTRGSEEVPVAIEHILRGIIDSGAQLKLLDLSDNAIGPIGAPPIIRFLSSSSSELIEKLYLHNCGLGPEGSTSISVPLVQLSNLREFICGRNRLEDKGATNISSALSRLDHLEVLKLNQNGIGLKGIKEIIKVIENTIDNIKELDLSDNTIKEEGADALSKCLSHARSLKALRLNDALLGNKGFKVIVDALSKSPAFNDLKEADFEGNELHGQKIIDFIESTFHSCDSCFTLNLLDNEFNNQERLRLGNLGGAFKVHVDDPDESDVGDLDDGSDDESEEGEIQSYSDDSSGGFVDLGVTEIREVVQDFLKEVSDKPVNEQEVNRAFMQLVSTGNRSKNELNFRAVQILCEELGLIKCESTRKKKPLAREAIVYMGKNKERLPKVFREYLVVVVRHSDDLSCSKLLFEDFQA